LKKLLYSGIIILVALTLFGQVYSQTVQVQIPSVKVSSARDVILVTVTVETDSHDQNGNYLITLESQYLTPSGFVVVNFQSVVVASHRHVEHVFRVPFKASGEYQLTAKVYDYPSMQLLGTATVDPPAFGRD
jgi:hypothetical protein